MVRIITGSFLFFMALSAGAQNSEVREILQKVRAAQPTDDQMAVYQHDWTATLKQAQARAKKENRPVFFIGNTNISGPTNFYSGHC